MQTTLLTICIYFSLISVTVAANLNGNAYLQHAINNYETYFNFPQIGKFNHTRNLFLSNLFESQHRVEDRISNPGKSLQISAKFEYDYLLRKDLEKEYIIAYIYDGANSTWENIGRYKTDRDGRISVPLSNKKSGKYIIRMVVEGDGSYADGLLTVVDEGRQAVVFDIDGTLTTSDFEMIPDVIGVRDAKAYYYAQNLLDLYQSKGYLIIYLTARPEWLTSVTKDWLKQQLHQPSYHLRTRGKITDDKAEYKLAYLKKLQQSLGISIVHTYGNAKTDIEAYKQIGIDDSQIYIIGKHAGKDNTTPIYDNYYDHYYDIEHRI